MPDDTKELLATKWAVSIMESDPQVLHEREARESVDAVLLAGLLLKARVIGDHRPDGGRAQVLALDAEQRQLAQRVNSADPGNRFGAWYGAEQTPAVDFEITPPLMRYPLVYWLDELFCDQQSKFGRDWDNGKLETLFFRSNTRAGDFWKIAAAVEAAGETGRRADDVMQLCVLLGFQGDRDAPQLRRWLDQRRAAARPLAPPPPINRAKPTPRSRMRPVRGHRRLVHARRAAMALAVVAALILVVLSLPLLVERLP